MLPRWCFGFSLLLAMLLPAAASADPIEPAKTLNTLADIGAALNRRWQWPPASAVNPGQELTVMLSFKRNGEILGGRITFASRSMTDADRALYHGALLEMLKRCSPMHFSDTLGGAVAGRPFTFYIRDTRGQRDL